MKRRTGGRSVQAPWNLDSVIYGDVSYLYPSVYIESKSNHTRKRSNHTRPHDPWMYIILYAMMSDT